LLDDVVLEMNPERGELMDEQTEQYLVAVAKLDGTPQKYAPCGNYALATLFEVLDFDSTTVTRYKALLLRTMSACVLLLTDILLLL